MNTNEGVSIRKSQSLKSDLLQEHASSVTI